MRGMIVVVSLPSCMTGCKPKVYRSGSVRRTSSLDNRFLREIDKGLAKSRVGLVLVTPAFLERIRSGGVSEKELSALLARDLLFPVIYKTTFDELRNVSPLLASRNGLDANEDPLEDIVTKIAELVTFENS